jgi:hypothetical protein
MPITVSALMIPIEMRKAVFNDGGAELVSDETDQSGFHRTDLIPAIALPMFGQCVGPKGDGD